MENVKNDNVIMSKSMDFSVRIVNLYKFLISVKNESVVAKQILRCGTSIGANIREAQNSISSAAFRSKMNIALSEAQESEYWLELLLKTEYITKVQYDSIITECNELNRLLLSIVKTAKP